MGQAGKEAGLSHLSGCHLLHRPAFPTRSGLASSSTRKSPGLATETGHVEKGLTVEPAVQAVPSWILCQERKSRAFQDGNKSAVVMRLLGVLS